MRFYLEKVKNLKQNDFPSPENICNIIYKLGVTQIYSMILRLSLSGKRNTDLLVTPRNALQVMLIPRLRDLSPPPPKQSHQK